MNDQTLEHTDPAPFHDLFESNPLASR